MGSKSTLLIVIIILGFPHAIVAHADPASPKLREVLEVYKTLPNVRGIRQLIGYHPTEESMRSTEEDCLKSGMNLTTTPKQQSAKLTQYSAMGERFGDVS